MRLVALLACIGLTLANPTRAQAPPGQFVTETVYNSPNGITTLAFDHAGRMLAAEKQGRIVLFAPNGSGGYLTPPTLFADLRSGIDSGGEAGLLGLELDPDYANNRYVYVFYTTPTDQRLVRLRANTGFDAVEPGVANVLLSGLPRLVNFHKAGDIHFSPADPTSIYVALGDDSRRALAQNLDAYEGKLLRVDAATGQGLSINPYYAGDASAIRARVWAIGLRNPFRFAFNPTQPSRTVLYSSENGDSTDRLSRMSQGSDGAWNAMGDGGGFLDPPDSNHVVLATSPPFVVGIAISPSGPFGTNVLYWGRGGMGGFSLRRFQLGGSGLDVATPLDGGADFVTGQSPIDLKFGPDGHLYGSMCGGGASTGGFFPLRRVRFAGGTPPTAAFAVAPGDNGPAPWHVDFADQSTDDGSIVQRQWDFGDGGGSSGSAMTGNDYTTPGVYTATLTVTDDSGLQSTASRTIRVTRATAIHLTGAVRDGRLGGAPGLAAATELRWYQADGITPIPFPGGSGASSNVSVVSAGGAFDVTASLALTGDAVVVSAGEAGADGVQHAVRGFIVPAGAGPHTLTADWFLSDTMIVGRVRDTRDAWLAVDVGILRNGLPHAIAGGRDFLPGSGLAPTGIAHRIVSDALGWYHIALRPADAGSFTLDAVADTGRDTRARVSRIATVAPASRETVDLLSGLWFGGENCDDLSFIQPLPSIDYATAVQPIFDAACTGCHAPNATNSGGLDLTEASSLAALVGVGSARAPGVPRVSPGEPVRSFLMEKIGCADPQAGTRMRPTDAMPLAQQATVRDWIVSLSAPAEHIFGSGFE